MKAFVRDIGGVEHMLREGEFGKFPGNNGDVWVMDRNAWNSPPDGLEPYLTEIQVGEQLGLDVPILAMVKALESIDVSAVSSELPATAAGLVTSANLSGGNLADLADALAAADPSQKRYWERVSVMQSDHPDIAAFAPMLGFDTPERVLAWFALGQVFEAKVIDMGLRTQRKDALLALFPAPA